MRIGARFIAICVLLSCWLIPSRVSADEIDPEGHPRVLS